jgi:AcrR family transcriptional regulator
MIIRFVNQGDLRERVWRAMLAEQTFILGVPPVPRVSAAHEQEVRARILAAASRVFAQKGFHSSTIADVCQESGLSVGAIYTYFSSKDELVRESCDVIAARGLDDLADRLTGTTTTLERMRIAIGLYVETIDEYAGGPGQISLVQAWAEADREPSVREMLAARRERLVGAGQLLLRQGIASGELPVWLDVDGVTRGLLALLDGLLLQRIEAGGSYRPVDLERRALAVLEPMLAAAGRPAPSNTQDPSGGQPTTPARA